MQVFHILSEFCTAQVLVGLGNLSILWNIKVSLNKGVICTGLYRQGFGTKHACSSEYFNSGSPGIKDSMHCSTFFTQYRKMCEHENVS